MAKRTTSSWRSSQKGIWGPGWLLIGCGRRGSRSAGTGGSITQEAPEGKAACSEVYSAAFSSPRYTIAQVQDRAEFFDRNEALCRHFLVPGAHVIGLVQSLQPRLSLAVRVAPDPAALPI